jgi:5'-nucleotidase
MPRILLTNDDGIAAPGLRALEEAMQSLGEVWVAAPASEQSATSRAITLRRPLRYEASGPRRYAVHGTPADTVMMAIHQILDFRPDLLVSGINQGPNLGENIFYSGTVAAAAEAVKYGIPAIAMSVDSRANADFSEAAAFAPKLAAQVLRRGLPAGVALNVNVPCPWSKGIEVTRQSQKISRNLMVEVFDPYERPYYWMHEEVPVDEAEPGTDYAAIRDGKISITPLRFDHTEESLIDEVGRWMNGDEL